ncbi:hypothetical protein D3C73_1407250 [compost metagenome]
MKILSPKVTIRASLNTGAVSGGVFHFFSQSGSEVVNSQPPNSPMDRLDAVSGDGLPFESIQ